jgi:TolB-like protein
MTSLRLRLIIIGFFALSLAAAAQVRVVVLPFRNMAHDIKYNPWNYQFADSLRSALLETDPSGSTYQIVPADSVELALADLNLDPDNPQYESDMWKAVRNLKAQKAVQGNFQLRGDRVLINCYIYDMESMLADATNQAKDIYKSPTTYLEAIRPIVKRILPGLSPQ